MATVFVSSVMEGYAPFRDAAARGIEAAGGSAIRVEDRPSLDKSSRNACLDLVEEADVYLLIVAPRGGWTTPSGLTATHEEFRHARKIGKPILVFLCGGDRDQAAEALATDASDYVDGRFRVTFSDAPDLQTAVENAVRSLLPLIEVPMRDAATVQQAAIGIPLNGGDSVLRVAAAPERDIELFDPVKLDDADLSDLLNRLGHESSVGLFSYERKKEVRVDRDSILITQVPERDPALLARVQLRPDGLIMVDTNVTGRQPRRQPSDLASHMAIVEPDVAAGAQRCLDMVAAVYEALDPYKRAEQILVSATLGDIGHRTWHKDLPTGGSYPMRAHGPELVAAFSAPRRVARSELANPKLLRDRIVVMLRRELEE